MCELYTASRAFLLRPHKLFHGGRELSAAQELEKLQREYNNELEIYFLKDGGFAVVIPHHFKGRQLTTTTAHLSTFLETAPRLVNVEELV